MPKTYLTQGTPQGGVGPTPGAQAPCSSARARTAAGSGFRLRIGGGRCGLQRTSRGAWHSLGRTRHQAGPSLRQITGQARDGLGGITHEAGHGRQVTG